MIEVKGKYNTAKVFNDNVEAEAISQIINLLSQPFAKGSQIRFMSDVHAGAGCTIGTTMTVEDKIVPNIVGVDSSCGIYTVWIKGCDLSESKFNKLDNFIRASIPSGTSVRQQAHEYQINLNWLRCAKHVNIDRAKLSMGTLGGGNHFIEVNKSDDGEVYLVIHSGSRNLGEQVCKYYQKLAWKNLNTNKAAEIIKQLKAEGREKEIQAELDKAKAESPKVPKGLAYLTGKDTEDYLHDMQILQKWAELNRKAIADDIIEHMGWTVTGSFTTTHNYVEDRMIRKGAVSAQLGEVLLIPMNMRDGSLLCVGKGNPDWNYSAPHGAGRLMSRTKAKAELSLDKYAADMKERGIYTTSVCQATLDECADAYKPIDEILSCIKDTVDVIKVIKPVYNYKDNSENEPIWKKRGK